MFYISNDNRKHQSGARRLEDCRELNLIKENKLDAMKHDSPITRRIWSIIELEIYKEIKRYLKIFLKSY